jgi:hypothetical protein
MMILMITINHQVCAYTSLHYFGRWKCFIVRFERQIKSANKADIYTQRATAVMFVCMYMYVCMHVYMYVCMYVRTYVYECMYVRTYVYECMCVYMYVCVCIYVRMFVCAYVCM